MVAKIMRDDDGVEPLNLRSKQLLTQIRAAVDQRARSGAFDQD
jgi:hypothetical protein